jgi:hypothetical protein
MHSVEQLIFTIQKVEFFAPQNISQCEDTVLQEINTIMSVL